MGPSLYTYTSHTGDVIEKIVEEPLPIAAHATTTLSPTTSSGHFTRPTNEMTLPILASPPTTDPISSTPPSPGSKPCCVSVCGSSSPLIQVIPPEKLKDSSPSKLSIPKEHPQSCLSKKDSRLKSSVKVFMVYNEYGELIDEQTLKYHPKPNDLSVIQILRVIRKAYHHQIRKKMGKILAPQMDGKASVLVEDGIWKDRLSSWDFVPRSPAPRFEGSPGEGHALAVYHGAPRVLELGCSDGSWCFEFKKEQPDWYVEGIDDTDHWSCMHRNVEIRDFMVPETGRSFSDYFAKVHGNQDKPEFTVRNLNCLLAHGTPLPHNHYDFIRGREIFDRIESYKTFLDDIRAILRPDGVVEFFEMDMRPRAACVPRIKREEEKRHQSGPQTDWTDKIEDRFKDPFDEELATTVPGWTARVAERMKANLRPRDGIAAPKLKSWLEGAGFWDVKQLILPIHVGGTSRSGQLLKEFLQYQIDLEDCIPKLKEQLPAIEMNVVESGDYHLNLHVVTGRKPHDPRPGDLLTDGTRQEMTASKYDAMARLNDAKTSQWKRYDLEGKLTNMMQNLTTLPGAPDSLSTITRGSSNDGLFPLMRTHTEIESSFIAPQFVTASTLNAPGKASIGNVQPTPTMH